MKKNSLLQILFVFLTITIFAANFSAQNPDKLAKADALIEEVMTLLKTNSFESANSVIAKSDEAQKIYEELKDAEKLRIAKTYYGLGFNALGSVFLNDGKNEKAVENFKKAVKIFTETGYKYGEGMSSHNLGILAVNANDYDKAIEYYEQATAAYAVAGETADEAIVHKNLGYLYSEKNNAAKAIENFEQWLKLQPNSEDRETLAKVLQKVGDLYLETKNYDKSEQNYLKALTIYFDLEDALQSALTLHNLGFIAGKKEKSDDALKYYEMALTAYRKAKHTSGEAAILFNLGVVNENRNDVVKARQFYAQSLEIRRKLNDREGVNDSLSRFGDSFLKTGDFKKAAVLYEELLANHRESKNREGIADALSRLGDLFFEVGNYEKSGGYYEEVVTIYRESKNRESEAVTLYSLGLVGFYTQNADKAAGNYQKALKIYRELGNAKLEGAVLLDLARLNLYNLRNFQESRKYIEQSLEIFRRINDQLNEADALLEFGRYYQEIFDIEEAEMNFQMALSIHRKLDNKVGIGSAFTSLARIYSYQNLFEKAIEAGENARKSYVEDDKPKGIIAANIELALTYYFASKYSDSLKYYDEALTIARKFEDGGQEASVLANTAMLYDKIAQYDKALRNYFEALEIERKINSRQDEAIILTNIGFLYFRLGKYDPAKEYTEAGIEILREQKLPLQEAYAVHNLGLIYYKLKDYKKALKLYEQAEKVYVETKDQRPEAYIYDSYGELYRDMGEYEQAFVYLSKSAILANKINHREVEINALSNLMTLFEKQNKPRIGVFYGKQAVNLLQNIRKDSGGLDKDSQKTLVKSYEKIYQKLADLLVAEGRLPEAQKVLEMLKEKSYSEFVTRDAGEAAALAKISERPDEREALEKYSEYVKTITADGAELAELQTKKYNLKEGEMFTEQARYDELKRRIEAANEAFRILLEKNFTKDVDRLQIKEIQQDRALQGKLEKWGKGTVAVYTLIAEDRYRVILTTPKVQVDGKTEIKAADLNKKIGDFRQILLDPTLDPRPLGKELYDILVKPIEANLLNSGAETLLWSLNGSLNYIPIGALYDGEKYLAEKYQNVVVTSTTRASLSEEPNKDWRVLGVGVTGASEVVEPLEAGKIPFPALPAVGEELQTIVKSESGKGAEGILPGLRLVDSTFTEKSLKENVSRREAGERKFNVIHFATHFRLGNLPENSFLLLGNNEILTLKNVNASDDLRLEDIELVTLSACNTGFGGISGINEDNKAIDSLAAFIESRGAKSVIASLWAVNDESTSLLMSEFYRLRKENPNMTKAEAMQTAQKMMISGDLKTKTPNAKDRSGVMFQDQLKTKPNAPKFTADPKKPFAHPLYWSPFVLIGNWR